MATPVQVSTTLTKEALRRSWEQFLRKYKRADLDSVALAYPEETSLAVPYWQLSKHDDELADATLENPEESLEAASEAVRRLETPVDGTLDLTVRVHSLPAHWRVQVRELRSEHLGRLIAIRGLVKKSSEVRPKLVVGAFACRRCGHKQRVEQDEHLSFKEPSGCPQCEKNSQFRFLEGESTFVDTQRVELQEPPEGLRGGEQPERLAAYVEGDLAGDTAAGDRVVLNGVLRSDQRRIKGQDSTLFDLFLEVNSVEVQEQEFEEVDISDEEVEEILDFAQDPELYQKITDSVAPTIQGMSMEKQALAMQLFGGVAKRMPDGSRIRGDIHTLLVGDPGVAKSQLLRFAAKLSPRSVYTSGKSSSAAGLTAAAVRDDLADGRWTLEAGALVLADKGLCAVDEIDKMDSKDQSSMHEAMEQQTVSIAKAGITAELRSRCAILGAANPKFGRFDPNQPLAEQITMEPALMSRFDVIFTLKDEPDADHDAELADHIMQVHRAGAIHEYREHHEEGMYTSEDEETAQQAVDAPVDEEFLRKYIAYAKRECFPVLTQEARERLQEYYVNIRKEAGGEEGGRIPMTPRQLEALVRLTESSARMRLSNKAELEDAQRAIDVVKYWIQRLSGGQGLMDIDLVASGVGSSQRERIRMLLDVIRELSEEHPEGAPREEIVARAAEKGVTEHQVEDTIRMLKNQRGTIYSPDNGEHFRLVRD
jgi:replicative DNA helicase Mcm